MDGARQADRDGRRGRRRRVRRFLAVLVAAVLAVVVAKGFPRWFPEFSASATAWITTSNLGPPPADLADLPLKVSAPGDRGLAVILSGNAGWWAIDDDVADGLSAARWTVAGLNSLRLFGAFGRPKTPADIAPVLARVVERLAPPGRPVVLVGYSFGADVLAVTYAGLPEAVRARVSRLVLLSPSREADYAIGISVLFPFRHGFARDVVAAIRALPPGVALCVYGRKQPVEDTACLDPALAGVDTLAMPGAHHFDGHYAALTQAVLARLGR